MSANSKQLYYSVTSREKCNFCRLSHFVKVSQWMKITILFERFIVLMWKHLNFQLFCFCYSVVNVGSVFTEAQPGSTLTALCFEIAYSLLIKIIFCKLWWTLSLIYSYFNLRFESQWKSEAIENDLKLKRIKRFITGKFFMLLFKK